MTSGLPSCAALAICALLAGCKDSKEPAQVPAPAPRPPPAPPVALARDGIVVLNEFVARSGFLDIGGEVTWPGERVVLQLDDVVYRGAPELEVAQAARELAGGGEPRAFRVQGERKDGTRYTATGWYEIRYGDQLTRDLLDGPEAMADAKRVGSVEKNDAWLRVRDLPVLPDTIAIRALYGDVVLRELKRPSDQTVTFRFVPVYASDPPGIDAKQGRPVLVWIAPSPSWLQYEDPSRWTRRANAQTTPGTEVAATPSEQRWRVRMTDCFQLLNAELRLPPVPR